MHLILSLAKSHARQSLGGFAILRAEMEPG